MSLDGNADSGQFIARQFAVGFGAVSVVAMLMCGMLLWSLQDVSQLVTGMQHKEEPIREGFELAVSVRELANHISHAMFEADGTHLDDYRKWLDRVRARSAGLAQYIPSGERWRLGKLAAKTDAMHEAFVSLGLPAARRGDAEAARVAHRRIDVLGQEAAEQADALARAAESQMAHAHVLATDTTRLGLLAGALCMLLVVALSVAFTFHLRRVVLRPLVVLAGAARRFGAGDFGVRVGEVGRGELGALGQALDHMAEELAAREKLLLQNERMAAIGQLAAGVAHELNNPIGIIRGYLKTMSADQDPETLTEELGILDEEAGHCQRIAEDLLAFARSRELDFESVDLGALLEETVRRFEESPAGEGTEIVHQSESAAVRVDRIRLRQVILNLLVNAVQASPPGGVVRIRGWTEAGAYHFEVADEGAGVSEVDRRRVFEPFYSKRKNGSGLGLAVCQGIIDAHEGQIEVLARAEESPGAVFRVRLPRRVETSP